MQHPQTQLDLYALALALVRDENVAGDLFVRARNAEHLQRLAFDWRRKNGLSEPPPAGPPYLTTDQIDFGMHLARRRVRWQQARVVGAGLAVVTLVVALALLPGLRAVTSPLLKDPTYASEATLKFGVPDQAVLEVYKAEATMGAVTVWWAISGRQAGRAVPPRLVLNDGQVLTANVVETARQGAGRTVGRSQFDLRTVKLRRVLVTVDDRTTGSRMVGVDVDLTRVPDPDARVVTLDKPLLDGTGSQAGVLTQVILGATYTIVQYRPEPVNFPGFEVLADGRPLDGLEEYYEAILQKGLQEFVFGPVPAGTRTLRLEPSSGRVSTTVRVPVDPRILPLEWAGTELRGRVHLPDEMQVVTDVARFVDKAGQSYSGTVRPVEGVSNIYEVSTFNVASGVELAEVSLSVLWSEPTMAVAIDLTK